MVKISQSHIRAWPIALPPLPVQEAIADFLDRETAKIDRLIEEKQRLIELLEEKRSAMCNLYVMNGGSDGQAVGRGVVPGAWTAVKVRRLITLVVRPVPVDPEETYREIGIRSWGKGIFHKEEVSGAQLAEKKIFTIRALLNYEWVAESPSAVGARSGRSPGSEAWEEGVWWR